MAHGLGEAQPKCRFRFVGTCSYRDHFRSHGTAGGAGLLGGCTIDLSAYVSASIEMAILLSDNSEVWARGIADEEFDDSNAAIFESIIAALSDRKYSMQNQFRLLVNNEIADSNVHRFAAFLHKRPGARRAWAKRIVTRIPGTSSSTETR